MPLERTAARIRSLAAAHWRRQADNGTMNRDHTLFHLGEAAEELRRTIDALKASPEYDYGEFWVAMPHLYHHLNTAWNASDEAPERVAACSEEDFARWRQFPTDLGLRNKLAGPSNIPLERTAGSVPPGRSVTDQTGNMGNTG